MKTKRKRTAFTLALLMLTGLATTVSAQVLDRTVLQIYPPYREPITELDARNAEKPPRFEVTPPEGAPNVVIVLIDDIGFGAVTSFGGRIHTPTFDRLADEAIRFTDAYPNASFCTPTRAALMSGQYQQRHGNEDLPQVTGPLPKAIKTLPDRLREAGYTTLMIGKWHLKSDPTGFDFWKVLLGQGPYYNPPMKTHARHLLPLLLLLLGARRPRSRGQNGEQESDGAQPAAAAQTGLRKYEVNLLVEGDGGDDVLEAVGQRHVDQRVGQRFA